MQYKAYQETKESALPPSLEVGTVMKRVVKVEHNTFKLNGVDTPAMRVFTDDKEYRTSSGVLMSQFDEFFKAHPAEIMENVKVTSPRGKNYLTLESSV